MGLSDCLHPCITGLRTLSFPAHSSIPFLEEGCRLSRFSRMEFPYMQEVSDRAGSGTHSPISRVPMLPSDSYNYVGTLISLVFAAQYSACTCPCLCFAYVLTKIYV